MPKKKKINITPTAAGLGLLEALEIEANKGRLDSARQKGRQHIGVTTDSDVADRLKAWAKERSTSRGFHCNFILEMALEKNMFSDIFD